MSTKKTIPVYITASLSHEVQKSVIQKLNDPKGQVDEHSQNHFDLSAVDANGKSVGDVVASHLRKGDNSDAAQIDGSLIVVADDGVSPSSHPQTVLIVQTSEAKDGNIRGAGKQYQAVRVLTSNAALVLATIERGQRWEDIWKVAQASGGHFPGE